MDRAVLTEVEFVSSPAAPRRAGRGTVFTGVRFVREICSGCSWSCSGWCSGELWKSCGEVCLKVRGKMVEYYWQFGGKDGFAQNEEKFFANLRKVVEKITQGFARGFFPVIWVVLHNFHKVYYNNY